MPLSVESGLSSSQRKVPWKGNTEHLMKTYIIVHLLFCCHTNPLQDLPSLTNRKSKSLEVNPKLSCLHHAKGAVPGSRSSMEPISVKGIWLALHSQRALGKCTRYKIQRMKLLRAWKYFSIPWRKCNNVALYVMQYYFCILFWQHG